MSVKIARITPGKISRRMNGEIDRIAVAVGQPLRESSHQYHTLLWRELNGKRNQVLSSDPCISARLGSLRRIPEIGPISCPSHIIVRKLFRQYNLLMHDILPLGMIVNLARAFVANSLPCPISHCAYGTAARCRGRMSSCSGDKWPLRLAPWHKSEKFGLEGIAGRRCLKWLLYPQKLNVRRSSLARRHKGAVELAVQFVITEHLPAVLAMIGPVGTLRCGAVTQPVIRR